MSEHGLNMVKRALIFLLFLLFSLPAFAGTVNGTVQFSNSAQTVNNGTSLIPVGDCLGHGRGGFCAG